MYIHLTQMDMHYSFDGVYFVECTFSHRTDKLLGPWLCLKALGQKKSKKWAED